MVGIIAAIIVIGLILIASEWLSRKKILQGEIARKFVHIVAGTYIATWSFYFSVQQIQILSAILLCGVLVSKIFNLFGSVHGVARQTWGEIFFALSIGMTVTFAQNTWVYTAAILHMSLADGLAAVIGTKYGRSNGYKVLGQYKTLIGSFIFFTVSAVILIWLYFFSAAPISGQAWLAIIWIPLFATITENLAIKGFDNIAVPVMIIAGVQLISVVTV